MRYAGNKNIITSVALVFACVVLAGGVARAQFASDKGMSVGVILGDPLGVTMKYRLSAENAVDVGFGPDYFGSPRLQIDYVWEFRAFPSNVVRAYAGPGLAVAFAKGIRIFFSREPHLESFANIEDNKFGFGARAIFGLDISRKHSPLEYFIEAGPLVAFNHIFDLDLDGAVGLRYNL